MGAPLGRMTWGGSSPVLPDDLRVASTGAAVYLLLAAAAMLVRAGDLGRGLPKRPFLWFNIFLTCQLALNTAGNLAAKTEAERYGMSAASAAGCLLCLWAAWPARRPTG